MYLCLTSKSPIVFGTTENRKRNPSQIFAILLKRNKSQLPFHAFHRIHKKKNKKQSHDKNTHHSQQLQKRNRTKHIAFVAQSSIDTPVYYIYLYNPTKYR